MGIEKLSGSIEKSGGKRREVLVQNLDCPVLNLETVGGAVD
jgi:hypothetical protein